jgi:HK97 family phage major capsid protein
MDDKKVEISAEDLKTLVKEASVNLVKEQVEAQVEALGLKSLETKFARLNPNTSIDELNKLNGKEKMAKLVKAIATKDSEAIASFKAMNETTGSAGAFLVPEEFRAEVYRIVEDFGLVAKYATKLSMGTDTLNVPTLASSVSISYPGEATAGTASQPVLAQVQLLAKTIVGLTVMSNELLADANVSVVDLLATLFAEAIAGEIDAQGLAGTGSPFTGILANTSVNTVTLAGGKTTFVSATLEDYRDLITQIKPWALQGAGYVMHRTVWANVQKLRTGGTNSGDFFGASTNAVIVGQAQGYPSAQAGFLWGYPVFLSDKMPAVADTAISTKFVAFGNLKHVFVGDRGSLEVSISTDGTVNSVSLFETNQSAVRVIARHAIAVGLPAAFAVLKTAAA